MYRFGIALIRIAAVAAVLFASGAARLEAAQCSISTTPVVFGTYNVFSSAPVDSTGTVSYQCNGGAKNVLLTMTRGQSVTYLPRQLEKGSEKLTYNLFLDAARTTIWGDFSAGTGGYSNVDPPNKQDFNVTVYGRIPAGQDISAGSYSDTVTVLMNF
jgi:spore coat protein U-like protein